MIKALNAKVGAIRTGADLNDDYVKSQVDAKTVDIMDKLTALSQAGHTTWNELETVKHSQMSEILVRMKDLQAQAAYGASAGSPQRNQFNANL